jgi:hypothetical protein
MKPSVMKFVIGFAAAPWVALFVVVLAIWGYDVWGDRNFVY